MFFPSILLVCFGVIWSAPLPLEIVDLTHVFDETTLRYPGEKKFQMNVTVNGTQEGGYWLQREDFSFGAHVGTHLDAPCHFVKGKWAVDQIPLPSLIAPAAVVDIGDNDDPDAELTVKDLRSWERTSGGSLNQTIVVLRSGWSSKWGDRAAYFGSESNDSRDFRFPGVSERAARWLVANRSAFGVATDALSIDAGRNLQELKAHQVLLGANLFALENVANADRLPVFGATLHVLPMKIGGKACAAPVRILATFPKVGFRDEEGETLREIIIFNK